MESPATKKSPWMSMLVPVLTAAVLGAFQGCGDDEEGHPGKPSPGGEIQILEPEEGATITTHSTSFAVALAQGVDPDGLEVALNGQDMTSHVRLQGNQATGNVYGMKQGSNVLSFTVPVPGRGGASAEVRFTFAPKPIDAVEAVHTYRVAGLQGVVDVLTDPWGVPHIYTREDNPDDLAFMQGYLTAR